MKKDTLGVVLVIAMSLLLLLYGCSEESPTEPPQYDIAVPCDSTAAVPGDTLQLRCFE